ncbi:MAG TPA: GDP-mannose 4,6-dehydratase [Solirubrobacteraceae bacterium]|nr:GDP-mannose 4,6-dehydratase [Solirubrobacteraceae bacterium]
MRVLITGASGFVGGWLARHCHEAGDEVIGLSRSGGRPAGVGRGIALDLRNHEALARTLAELRPEAIYHLAALSHVGRSWEDPASTLDANVGGAVALLEAVREAAPSTRLLWASSCEVYGRVAGLPVTEAAPLAPVNPYAVSKAAGDMLAGVYAEAHGLAVLRARPFNHVGPGQLPIFIVSSLAQQAARARLAGASELTIVTGTPDTRRDYTDVRDVCRAYRALITGPAPAGVYNVCSGVSTSARELVGLVAELIAPIRVDHEVDPDRVRAHEVLDHRGSAAALQAATGWTPQIPLRQTVADTIAWWETTLAARQRVQPAR